MADNVFDIGIGTKVDQSGAIEGVKETEDILDKSSDKLAGTVEKGGKKQSDSTNKTEKKKTEIVDKESKKRKKFLDDENKKSLDSVKGFAQGAAGELLGLDQVLGAIAGGPVAIGKAFIQMAGQAKQALDQMAASYREQEKAEVALRNAAENNPYLNDRSVKQLTAFANEMQRAAGIDSAQVLQTQARLATLGRDQEQIQKIIKTATDMSARGIMDYDSAINELNNSLNGMVRTSARLYPELKDLSKEALASGEAIDIIAKKVAGSAAEAMKTGAGSVLAYENAVGDLKRIIGQGWEEATKPGRVLATDLINIINEALSKNKQLKEAYANLKPGAGQSEKIKELNDDYKRLNEQLKDYQKQIKKAGESEKGELESGIERTKTAIERTQNDINKLKNMTSDNIDDMLSMLEASIAYSTDKTAIALNTLFGDFSTGFDNYMRVITYNFFGIMDIINDVATAQSAAAADVANKQEQFITAIEKKTKQLKEEQIGYGEIVGRIREKENEEYEKLINNIKEQASLNGLLENDIKTRIALAAAEMEYEQKLFDMARKETIDADKNQNNAENFRKENKNLLDEEIEKIKRRAELEGKSVEDLSVKKQILDANVQAYENLLVAAKGVIDGTATEEKERFAMLKSQWAAYEKQTETEKFTDEQRKKRLQEINELHKKNADELARIADSSLKEAEKQTELTIELDYQERLKSIRERSAKDAVEFEIQNAIEKAEKSAVIQKEQMESSFNEQKKYAKQLLDEELEKYKDNAGIKSELIKQFNEEQEELQTKYNETVLQIDDNLAFERLNIHKSMLEQMEKAEKESLQKQLSLIQEFMNAASSISNNISAIWTNNIDYETNERLKQNDEIIQSDEDRANKEKEIMIEAAEKRYEAELFAWQVNIQMAHANTAMAMLTAYQKGMEAGIGPSAPAMAALFMGLAAAIGGMNIAALISARPKPPRFHQGGVVPGMAGQEVPAVLMAGEPVLTQKQFGNVMQAFANVANSKMGGEGLVVNVQNNAANLVSTDYALDSGVLKMTVTKIVNESLGNGSLDHGLSAQQSNQRGVPLT